MTNDIKKLAADIAIYETLYEDMTQEGAKRAEQRKAMLGNWEPDTSKFRKLTDTQPALTAWKAHQSLSIDIIRRQQDVINELWEKARQHWARTEVCGQCCNLESLDRLETALAIAGPLVKEKGGSDD